MNRQYGALSGIAIALIALNHAIHFGLQVSPVAGGWLDLLIVMQAVGAFAVPIFLFISGSFLSYAAGELSLKFLRTNLARLLWPYLIWSVIFYALVLGLNHESYSVAGYVKNLLVGYPYYFVPLLIFWYLVAPLLAKVAKRYGVLLLAALGAYQVLLLTIRFPEMFGLVAPAPAWTRLLVPPVLFTTLSDWAIYFPLGLVLSMADARIKPALFRWRWVAVGAAAMLFLLGVLDAFKLVPAPWARFAAPLPLMFALPAINRNSIPLLRRFELLGRQSYGIYLSHFVIINLVVAIAARSGPGLAHNPLIVFPAFYLVALGLPVLLMDAAARTRPTRAAYRYVFGMMPPVQRAVARPARPSSLGQPSVERST